MKRVKTTVIGSYPIKIDNQELMNNYFNQSETSWNKYIDSAVNDQIKAGIDIISDGQTRDQFVNIFTRKLKGCRIRDRSEVVDKIAYTKPITVDDQVYVKKIIPKNKEIVGLITGPYTLMKSCVDFFYNDEKELAFDFAKVLNCEAKNLEKHVNLISVDEPFFSVEMPEYAKELIQTVFKNVSCTKRLHVCGDVSKIIPTLLEIPVQILSHEFKASPHLFDKFKKYDITKNICLGSVRSDKTKVEAVDEIIKHINHGVDIFGEKICQISPDCGLRLQPRNIAFQKLRNLVIAGGKIYG
jgi:5-methyltetrahydropteroyltriglutamate--homocysteine methyltransferase